MKDWKDDTTSACIASWHNGEVFEIKKVFYSLVMEVKWGEEIPARTREWLAQYLEPKEGLKKSPSVPKGTAYAIPDCSVCNHKMVCLMKPNRAKFFEPRQDA